MVALPSLKSKIFDYYTLTKPGIAFVVLFSTLTGYWISSPIAWNAKLFHTLFGTALVSFAAGMLNMVLEIDSDALMVRTRLRPLPDKRISPAVAFILGVFSGSIGIVHLCASVNLMAGFFASLSLVLYLVFYTPLKKISSICIGVGAISGALPPLIGNAAALGKIDAAGWILFVILFLWQFPHLLALFWMYQEDYERAQLKMVPFLDGEKGSARWAWMGTLLLVASSALPILFGISGWVYGVGAIAANIALLFFAWTFYKTVSKKSAKQLFLTTIFYIPFLFGLLLLS